MTPDQADSYVEQLKDLSSHRDREEFFELLNEADEEAKSDATAVGRYLKFSVADNFAYYLIIYNHGDFLRARHVGGYRDQNVDAANGKVFPGTAKQNISRRETVEDVFSE